MILIPIENSRFHSQILETRLKIGFKDIKLLFSTENKKHFHKLLKFKAFWR